MSALELSGFLDWFTRCNGSFDKESIGFTDFPPSEGGRGAVALKDIPEGHTLFTIPRSLTLSTRTSSLVNLMGQEKWKEYKLDEGWVGLILCMMWESAQGSTSFWVEYLQTLPTTFNTPMFWSEDDLEALKGTTILEKLGRKDAERDYNEKILPAVKSRPDLFPPELHPVNYTLEQYHIMGSRILSRSFDVERWESEYGENEAANTSAASAMDVDQLVAPPEPQEEEIHEEEEDPVDVSMVPMADLLNARYGSENAKLFYEEASLRMVATKPVKTGEQIWNTYGDLPNAELLRRYGHVDLLPLPDGTEGNPGDIVEIRADLVVSAVTESHGNSTESCKERIDWYLEEGGDDVLAVESDAELPSSMILLIQLLLLQDREWQKLRQKRKLPKAKADAAVLEIVHRAKDEASFEELSLSKRHAIIVRLGEIKILRALLRRAETLLDAESKGTNKRKASIDGSETFKKTKEWKTKLRKYSS
ncbi:set domain protein, partial [Moniliophthora roreri]